MRYETDLPTLVTSDDSATVVIQPRYCQVEQSYCAVTFSDNKRRYFTGALQVAVATTGEGGLDVTPAANLYFYNFYLVPSAADDDQCAAIASIAHPDTGPSGYSVFRYIGRVRHNSGWIRQLNDGCWSHVLYQPHSYEFGPLTQAAGDKWNVMDWHGSDADNLPPEWSTVCDATMISRTGTDVQTFVVGSDATPHGVQRTGDIDIENQSGTEVDIRIDPDTGDAFNSSIVGRKITVSGCANGGNNGTFEVLALVDSSAITVENASAVEASEAGATMRSGFVGQYTSNAIRTAGGLDCTNGRQVVSRHLGDDYMSVYFSGAHPSVFVMWANAYWDNLLEG